ncbi:MAG: von Willebrand factor type A domain-containing protein [Bacillota bacterium]|nr:von Willebrand factor type A domain-containing protein [Bacillota bacterium]
MNEIERMIKRNEREQFYDYYIGLGYDHKVAAVLALFTYGDGRSRAVSIDRLYDDICKGRADMREVSEAAAEARYTAGGVQAPRKLRAMSVNRVSEPEYASYDASCDEAADMCCCESAGMSELGIPRFLRDEGFATDEYEPIEEKDARSTAQESTSTFRMTTNTASAGVILNQLRNDRGIDQSMVRIEEMLNYFRYDSEIPKDDMFNITSELMDLSDDRKCLYINAQGREEVKDRQNIIILLDVSGSMCSNAEQTQAAIATIISKLGNGDKLSLVTYSNRDRVELDALTINGYEDRLRTLETLLSIQISGFTCGSRGIERAYEIGKKNYIEGGNNQVILITDGDLNFGITDKGGLEELIERKKKDNLFLSVIGTGLFNYKDDKLETISKHGNGVYRVVNNLADVKKSIDDEYASLVNIIAKDVKAQVEFNPEIVESYRLLGFENRELAREDFSNDKVISEPFGSGGHGVALYELKLKTDDAPVDSGLKYSKLVTTGSSELGTVKIRYKEPLEDVSHEMEKVLETAEASFTDNLRLAFIVYVCSEKLRGSDKIGPAEIDVAKQLYAELGDSIKEKNAADLYKLAGILDRTERELGVRKRRYTIEDYMW